VRLSVWDRVTVGGGRTVLGVSPKKQQKSFLRTTAIRCTQSRSCLEAKRHPHPHLTVQWRTLRHSGCMLPCTYPLLHQSSNDLLTQLFVLHEAMQIKQRSVTLPGPYPRPPAEDSWRSRAERARRPTASKSNKNVTGLSRARERPKAQVPSHSVRWSGSEECWHISAGTSNAKACARNVKTE